MAGVPTTPRAILARLVKLGESIADCDKSATGCQQGRWTAKWCASSRLHTHDSALLEEKRDSLLLSCRARWCLGWPVLNLASGQFSCAKPRRKIAPLNWNACTPPNTSRRTPAVCRYTASLSDGQGTQADAEGAARFAFGSTRAACFVSTVFATRDLAGFGAMISAWAASCRPCSVTPSSRRDRRQPYPFITDLPRESLCAHGPPAHGAIWKSPKTCAGKCSYPALAARTCATNMAAVCCILAAPSAA